MQLTQKKEVKKTAVGGQVNPLNASLLCTAQVSKGPRSDSAVGAEGCLRLCMSRQNCV